MSTGAVSAPMAQPLATSHFKPPPRNPVSAMPQATKLAARLSEACARAFSSVTGASWQVTLDRIEDDAREAAVGETAAARFESDAGSLTFTFTVDRTTLSALVESAMGGNGAEAPFDMAERPPSKIEIALLELFQAALAKEVVETLTGLLGRPFNHFEDHEEDDVPAGSGGLVVFRFLVNIFGYSGEVHMAAAGIELSRQLGADQQETAGAALTAAKQTLQRQVGQALADVIVTLGEETFPVQQIATLTPGMQLELSSLVSAPVTVWSGGIAAYRGTLARAGERLAVRITGPAA